MVGIRTYMKNLREANGFRQGVNNTVDHFKQNPLDIGGHMANIGSNVSNYLNLSPGARGVVNNTIQRKLNETWDRMNENAAKQLESQGNQGADGAQGQGGENASPAESTPGSTNQDIQNPPGLDPAPAAGGVPANSGAPQNSGGGENLPGSPGNNNNGSQPQPPG